MSCVWQALVVALWLGLASASEAWDTQRPLVRAMDVALPVNTNEVEYASPLCVVTLLANHSFGASYWRPYRGPFDPPSCSHVIARSTAVYLRWSASVPSGRQFDRIAAVWVNGFELLRTTTEEPSPDAGATWEVLKDISHYKDVLTKGGNVVVALDNVVDQTYTSSFTVSVTAEYYKAKPTHRAQLAQPDAIVAVSNSRGNYGWFNVQPSSRGSNGALVTVPRNTEQLFLEVFTSHHGCDEFWYSNPPNEYKEPLQTNCGNGAFREFHVLVDSTVVGTIWPFPLVYTGGISPYMWRPIVATGAFEAPTYLVDLTPFVGTFVDGQPHNVSFDVGFGLDYWPTTGNLLVYVDKNGTQTHGVVHNMSIPNLATPLVTKDVHGLNMTFNTVATRQNRASTLITTSKGAYYYTFDQVFSFANTQIYASNGSTQWFDQHSHVTTTTSITPVRQHPMS